MSLRRVHQVAQDEPRLVRQERQINKGYVQQQIASSMQRFEGSRIDALAAPIRVELGYDAILMCALSLFAALGYRVTSDPGHHRIALEALCAELKLSEQTYMEIMQLLELRNNKYTQKNEASKADMELAMYLSQKALTELEQ